MGSSYHELNIGFFPHNHAFGAYQLILIRSATFYIIDELPISVCSNEAVRVSTLAKS